MELIVALLAFAAVEDRNIARSVLLFVMAQSVVAYHLYSHSHFMAAFYFVIFSALIPVLAFVGVNLTRGESHYGKRWVGLVGLIFLCALTFPSGESRVVFEIRDVWRAYGKYALLQFYLMLASIPAIKHLFGEKND